jgi:two-component system response regulator HydG
MPEDCAPLAPARALARFVFLANAMKERVLVIDDDPQQCALLAQLVGRLDYATAVAHSDPEAIELVKNQPFEAVLTDLDLGASSGVDLCERVRALRADLPVILVSGVGSMESAVAAMRAGAYDFLAKPIDANALGLALRRATESRRLREEVRMLRATHASPAGDKMIGDGPAIQRVRELIARVANTDVSVLVEGETGTGKELVARAIHAASPRASGPFVAINCAAVPANLLESELFGHARGAFTDAKVARDGLFVQASGGTLFLDEIGEMPLEMQAKLLRALQERMVRPVGSNQEIAFDARIVAATHRDLEGECNAKRFREDLYYRINVVKIAVPPLRDRGNDILLLATHFLKASRVDRTALRADAPSGERPQREDIHLSPAVATLLLNYDWPGNVRELENCIERAVALARFSELSADDLPDKVRSFSPKRFVLSADTEEEILSLDELERRYILRALKILGGNRSRAATLLGLDRRTLYRRLEKYDAGSNGSAAPPPLSEPPSAEG